MEHKDSVILLKELPTDRESDETNSPSRTQ
jgi:hypothetical protein